MTPKYDYIGNFKTEHYKVHLDGVEVDRVSAGCWAPLEEILIAAENNIVNERLNKRKILIRYVNIEKSVIMFWTYKEDEWFTL